MKVLWFTNTTSLYEQGNHNYHGGGWIDSLEKLLREKNEVELAVSFFHPNHNGRVEQNGRTYYPIKRASGKYKPLKTIFNNLAGSIENANEFVPELMKVVEHFKPDVIHVFGTEGIFGLIQSHTKVPVIIHLQGLINPIKNAYYPAGFDKYGFLCSWQYVLKNLKGSSPFFGCQKFTNQAIREQKHFLDSRYVMGRTQWDRQVSKLLAPQSEYFHVDEVLRPLFYNVKRKCKQPNQVISIVSTLSPTLYKGIDVVLKTAELLKKVTKVDFEWKIVGLKDDDLLLRHFEKKLKISHKNNHIICMGSQVSDQLVKLLSDADLFVHPSYIDNSPNSVCEAQMLGLPVIACNVGGVGTLIKNGETGMLVPSNGVFELAHIINDFSLVAEKYLEIGQKARHAAMERHDKKKIEAQLMNAYNSIIYPCKE
ncbi:MAG: glycosyltransferase family 4 protein [Bacteroidales bacterium]|nr:glycosyltransferase family 4 protein [Bacteroidales bacterium]